MGSMLGPLIFGNSHVSVALPRGSAMSLIVTSNCLPTIAGLSW